MGKGKFKARQRSETERNFLYWSRWRRIQRHPQKCVEKTGKASWPEVWRKIGKAAQNRENRNGQRKNQSSTTFGNWEEFPLLIPMTKNTKEILKNAWRKLERPCGQKYGQNRENRNGQRKNQSSTTFGNWEEFRLLIQMTKNTKKASKNAWRKLERPYGQKYARRLVKPLRIEKTGMGKGKTKARQRSETERNFIYWSRWRRIQRSPQRCVEKTGKTLWPEVWTKIGKAAQNREKQEWAKEKPKLDNVRKLRGISFIDPDDEEYKEVLKDAWRKLERPYGQKYGRRLVKPLRIEKTGMGKGKTKARQRSETERNFLYWSRWRRIQRNPQTCVEKTGKTLWPEV